MSERTTDALGEWAAQLDPDSLPGDVIAKAEDCIIDAVACALAGQNVEAVRHARHVSVAQYRDGPCGIWFRPERLNMTGASFVNAMAASILDLDDGHRLPCGHPGAAVVPAALAVAEEVEASGLELLAAIVAGYEVAARIGGAENRIAYHTGNWTGFGVAAAAGRLKGLDADRLAHALAITAYHGPRVADLTLSRDMGSNVKESLPWSVVVGLNAVELAAQGFTGCRDALDIDERFRPGQALDDLGNGFQIMQTYFKRYSACRWVHPAIEGLLGLMREQELAAEGISDVRIETFHQAASLNNLSDPPSLESAQYSIPYCLGLAATRGERALMPIAPEHLHDPAATGFAEKVSVVCDEVLSPHFPQTLPTRVQITTPETTFETFVDAPWGEPVHPPRRGELADKFKSFVRPPLTAANVDAIVEAIEELKTGPVGPVSRLLQAH